jgi:hypothetical protein
VDDLGKRGILTHLFGTEFQKKVWRKLWELTQPDTD